jgi:adenosylmethionine-8-amino-7-oxononanoate aminotransferase
MLRPLGNVIVLMPAPGMDASTLQTLLSVVHETLKTNLPTLVRQA